MYDHHVLNVGGNSSLYRSSPSAHTTGQVIVSFEDLLMVSIEKRKKKTT